MNSLVLPMLFAALVLAACAPSAQRPTSNPVEAMVPGRTLVLIGRQEPGTLAATQLLAVGIGGTASRRLFNAGLTNLDAENKPVPYLAASLPQLNSQSWRVLPNGGMETTYPLRPNLTWHDGTPLTATDFVFAWQVYRTPEFGTATSPPHTAIEAIAAPDDRTVAIRWRGLYPGAGTLIGLGGAGSNASFAPLPKHLLEALYAQDHVGFAKLPFWTVEYVGAGPYKLDRWDPGSFIQGEAFEGHALGKPRIDRMRIVFNNDANSVLAQLLSGESHLAIDQSIGIEQGIVLKRDWDARGAGTVFFPPTSGRYVRVQLRPEYARSPAILDLQVRKALALAIDKQAINDSILHGLAVRSDSMIPPTSELAALGEALIPTYPFDPRRAEQLMQGAGYVRDHEGLFFGSAEGRLNFEVKNITQAQFDAERSILANNWRQFGLEIEEASYRPLEASDGQALSTFRSLSPTGGNPGADRLLYFTTANITSPANNWVGSNRGGWSNAEYDRLMDLWSSTLDEGERSRQIVQAARIINEEIPVMSLYYAPSVVAYSSLLHGIDVKSSDASPDWNIQEWELS